MTPSTSEKKLNRALTLFPTTAIVVGSVIGSGIFVSSASMARQVGTGPLLLFVWLLAGVMTWFGALTQCELTGQIPRTGGLYEYFKVIYGEQVGFFYGWANFIIAGSGAIAAIAYIFGSYFSEFVALPRFSEAVEKYAVQIPLMGTLFPFAALGPKLVGAFLIVLLTTVNIKGVRIGAGLQSVSTSAKAIALFLIIVAAFVFGGDVGNTANWFSSGSVQHTGATAFAAVTLALSGAFWAYDGWGNAAYIAGEVKDPARTVPRAILLGALCFTSLYLLINLAYLYILPIEALQAVSQDRVASAVVSAVFGPVGGICVALMVLLSTFDTVNSSILANSRVYFAMAEKGLFPQAAGRVHEKYQTPYISLILQGSWALILLFSGSFEIITSMYVFVNWMLYVLMGLGVFILRKRHPQGERPFRTPGYPWVPLIYVLFAFGYVVMTLVSDFNAYRSGQQVFLQSVMGLVLVGSGWPLYLYLKARKDKKAFP